MNGARTVVEMLMQYQTEVIFGVPGDTSIGLYEALYDVLPKIRHVMARDERSASFMADAYARLSHRPGICECPSGAGPLYAIPGIAEANASSIPVILLTSDIPLSGEGKQTITELNCEKLFETVTKWSYQLKDVNKIPEVVRRAYRIATTGRPGAVHLALPLETQKDAFAGKAVDLYAEGECASYPAYRARGARAVLENLCKILVNSKKPVIIAGGGANHSQAESAVLALAEWLSAPVVTTISGQGIIADNHFLAMGVTGDNGFHPHAHRAIEQGDVLLYVGCKMGSVSTLQWTLPGKYSDKQIVQIDLNPEFLGNNYQNSLSVAGDAKLILGDLLVLIKLESIKKETTEWVGSLNMARDIFWQRSMTAFESNGSPLKPERIISSLNRYLTSTSVVIADAGTPTPYITRFLKLGGNGSRFIIPRAYGGLGYVIPALVGAHYARPEARLVGLFGDGSLGMSAGELETLSRLNIPAVMLHFNNGMFGWIKALQKLHAKEKYYSVDFQPGDMSALAAVYGIKGFHVKSAAELDAALNEAFKHDGPVFIDIVSESEVADLPPVFSWEKTTSG